MHSALPIILSTRELVADLERMVERTTSEIERLVAHRHSS